MVALYMFLVVCKLDFELNLKPPFEIQGGQKENENAKVAKIHMVYVYVCIYP